MRALPLFACDKQKGVFIIKAALMDYSWGVVLGTDPGHAVSGRLVRKQMG